MGNCPSTSESPSHSKSQSKSKNPQPKQNKPTKKEPLGFQRRAYWMYQKDNIEWEHYSDIENEIIEDAFSADQPEVILDKDHIIDLKNLLQISHGQTQKIKREIDIYIQEYTREERFHLPESNLKSPATFSEDNPEAHPPIIKAWAQKHQLDIDNHTIWHTVHHDPPIQKCLSFFQRIIEMASKGIIQHGEELGKKEQAEWISNQLLEALSKYKQKQDISIIENCCISLYTRESFLYKSINKMLREEDSSQVDTLGPFCYLLNGFLESETYYFGAGWAGFTYRGVNLTPEMLEEYKRAHEKGQVFTWPGFTSTSRSRERAEKFGNTLFIFNNVYNRAKKGLWIEKQSVYPREMEVLYPSNSRLRIREIEIDRDTGKTLIHLSRILI